MPKGVTMQTSQAAVGYNYCNKLFALEKKYANMNSQSRKFARQAEAEPLLDAYWLWLKTLDPVSESKLEEAVTPKGQSLCICRARRGENLQQCGRGCDSPLCCGTKELAVLEHDKGDQFQRYCLHACGDGKSQRC